MRLFVVAMALAAGQSAHEKRPEIPAQLRPLIDTARAAPPEFFADAIIRRQEAGKIPGRDLQRELLEEAFQAASRVQVPVRLIATSATPPDSRAIYRGMAGTLQLDALSLETRIVRATLNVDRAKARELFSRIVKPSVEARSCEDPLLPDDSAYFELAGTLAQSTFTEQEKQKEVHAQFLDSMLTNARTPFELAGFLRGIESTGLSNDQWQLIAATLASKLESMKPDYRSFAMSTDPLTGPGLQRAIEHFATRLESQGITTEVLSRGFRSYLVTQLSAPRCADSPNAGKDSIEWFNSNFRGQLPPIVDQEIAPAAKSGSAKVDIYFQSDDTAHQLSKQLQALRVNSADGQFSDFLRDWIAWRPQVSSDVDAFHEKATLLRGAFQLSVPAEDRTRLIARAVEFLRNSGAERAAPAEWLWETKEIATAAGTDRSKLLAAFRDSADPGLVLYAMLGG